MLNRPSVVPDKLDPISEVDDEEEEKVSKQSVSSSGISRQSSGGMLNKVLGKSDLKVQSSKSQFGKQLAKETGRKSEQSQSLSMSISEMERHVNEMSNGIPA